MPAEPPGRQPAGRPAALLLAGLVLAACTGTGGPGSGSGTKAGDPVADVAVASYVALGDSYTAAPFVPSTELAAGCFRSDSNYPSLLEQRLRPDRFVDVSCSAAQTADLTRPQASAGGRGRVPPQLRAVDRRTDLVTVGIGANDEGLFATLVSRCTSPDAGALCDATLLSQARAVLTRTSERVVSSLQRVQRRAPDAVVVLVGYPRLVDPETPCPRVPVPRGSLAALSEVERLLNRTLRQAAEQAGADYVDMHTASRGHEICSDDPWVNGRRTDEQAALAYHPFASGQAAVADRVMDLLAERADRGGS